MGAGVLYWIGIATAVLIVAIRVPGVTRRTRAATAVPATVDATSAAPSHLSEAEVSELLHERRQLRAQLKVLRDELTDVQARMLSDRERPIARDVELERRRALTARALARRPTIVGEPTGARLGNSPRRSA